AANHAVVAVTQHQRRVAEILEQEGIGVTQADSLDTAPSPGQVCLLPGSLRDGWTVDLPNSNGDSNEVGSLVLLTDSELFGTVKEQRYHRRRKAEHGPEVVLADLVPGAHVVHIDHGVARFAGTTHIGDDDDEKEYLILEYAENDKLYVPTDHLDRVSAYVGAQDQPPSPTRLSTAEWARVKQRVKGATREMAEELLRINAARALAEGHEHGADTVWQQELEDSFPFVETPDQAKAIIDVKNDMETMRPMDRLICGDVGYGKTEIALRAAFKSVNDGMQVGMLVPTTVLAQQHYATFSERLSPFPVKIEVLSRFRTPKEQQQVIEGLNDGSVDIVIGTHRLLQKDVHFKNLGLAIVDEEQRFGVSHKERLKQLRKEVDVLTLSATPIPRTLNMALAGIRDLSTMDSAPEARLPVKTFVSEYSEDVIKEAILREMERGGQVFYLHNRVRTIHQAAADLLKLVPHARILVGHGQMAETELEDVMVDFANGEADILVCTTIIESGLDMPNVNTLIVERADRFGLAQLYQLRGRVGRSEHRAYAYLMAPRGRRITEAAEHRLQAILEASELGAGFRIAMRDLEIRGAGNILGASQSGHIQDVGLDLYTQLLSEAVRELEEESGESGPAESPATELPRIDLPLNARIPEDYVDHLPTRLAVYQRLAKLADSDDIPVIREELRDRFGPVPEEVENLLTLAGLRALAATVGIESVVQANDAIVLSLRVPVGGARVPLQKALGPSVQVGNTQMHMPLRRLGDEWLSRLTRVLERFFVFQENLKVLAGSASGD
ncbi:MAG: transcription-repair coupling factor, partial [Dehalococcoidia bacterium]